MPVELATVADDEAVLFEDGTAHRYTGLQPGTEQCVGPHTVRTLRRPPGDRLATVATVNDVHLGETVCGLIAGVDLGPALSTEPGQQPYPLVMSRAAVTEIGALAPDAVVAKGDLTASGTAEQYQQFQGLYGSAFGARLIATRGNHDNHDSTGVPVPPSVQIAELPGVTLAVLDTSRPGRVGGAVDDDQAGCLDDLAARADRPVLVFGHHPPADDNPLRYQGHPVLAAGLGHRSTARLAEVFARRPAIVGYFAGHTHRNKVRHLPATGSFPWVEVACVKDFPGTWAEYRVFEGGILQLHRRIHSDPAAVNWSQRCRALYGGLYPAYAWGSVRDRCFEIGLRDSGR
jgi:predicted phosphodiesterase